MEVSYLSVLLMVIQQYKSAAYWFRQVLLKDPSLVEPYFYLGQLHEYGLGVDRDYTSALRYYR